MKQKAVARLVKYVGWALIVYALIWATAAYQNINAPARILLDVLAWPIGDGMPVWDAQLAWMSSIGAGLLMALGVLFVGVVYPAVKIGDQKVVRVTILAWFVVDSAGSVAVGFWPNSVINLIMLVPILAPLLMALKQRRVDS